MQKLKIKDIVMVALISALYLILYTVSGMGTMIIGPMGHAISPGLCGLITGSIFFFITRKIFANQLKKNPPVSEAMIRAMMTQMGRTPSEKQVRAVMRSMEDEKTKEERAKKAAKNK